MSKEEYILENFPSDEEMEKAARKCTMLAYDASVWASS